MTVYYEDIGPGSMWRSRDYPVALDEMVAFARQWDPRPFHVDPDAAAATHFGGLIASAAYTLSVFLKLSTEGENDWATMGAIGWDEVRFRQPVRPGDVLTVTSEVIDMRPSKSRPDTGIVVTRNLIVNQRGETVISFTSPFLMAMREGAAGSG